jgi:beta-galactosidase
MKTITNYVFHGLGTTFYPEHHDSDGWPEFIRLMQEAGIKFVRLGEFNWSLFEPEEGEYNLDWLDEVLEMLADANIKVFMATQTSCPPLWACEKYPDILPTLQDGRTYSFGERRYTCPSSSSYRRLSRQLVKKLAMKFADNPLIFAWQLDNEPGSPFCFCQTCLVKFQDWCEQRFTDISNFNEKLLTKFWGQTFSSFSEIPFPTTYNGNSLWLLYHQFHSDNIISSLQEQIDELKANGVTTPITTNMMLAWYGYDHEELATQLDVAGGDLYNSESFFGDDWASDAFFSAYLRATKQGDNFWFEEIQVGLHKNIRLLPGQLRFQTLSRIGMGADMFNFFRWDMARAGAERDECALLNSHEPGRVYYEIKTMQHEVELLTPYLNGTKTKRADIAILHTWDNHYEFAAEPKIDEFDAPFGNGYPLHLLHHYRAVCQNGHTVDLIYPGGDFEQYKCLIIPALYVIDEKLTERIKQFISNGGICLMTSFSGVVNEDGLMWHVPRPALLQKTFGMKVIDYSRIYEKHGECNLIGNNNDDITLTAKWIDEVIPEADCEVLLKFKNKYFDNVPALTKHQSGNGEAWYFGSLLNPDDYRSFYSFFLRESQLKPLMALPEGVSLGVREHDNFELYFLANESEHELNIKLPEAGIDLLNNSKSVKSVTIGKNDVKVIKFDKKQRNL